MRLAMANPAPGVPEMKNSVGLGDLISNPARSRLSDQLAATLAPC
jgi:hypothetical protein